MIIIRDLPAWSAALLDAPQVMYWRTASGREVDFVVEWKGMGCRRVSARTGEPT
jgi:hypothetical protein